MVVQLFNIHLKSQRSPILVSGKYTIPYTQPGPIVAEVSWSVLKYTDPNWIWSVCRARLRVRNRISLYLGLRLHLAVYRHVGILGKLGLVMG